MATLSEAQKRVLAAVAEGRVSFARDMGWFQKGGYRLVGGRNPNPATMDKLTALGFITRKSVGMGETHADVLLTPAGKAALDGRLV